MSSSPYIILNSFSFSVVFLCFGLLFNACSSPIIDLSKEKFALEELQKQEQTAHLQEEPALLVNMLHDTLTQVKNGVVSYFTKDQMTERFNNYFSSVEFIQWKDAKPPVYTISDDGSMAQILIQKHVEVNLEREGTTTRESTDFVWTELWRKKEGRWKMYMVTTTEITKD